MANNNQQEIQSEATGLVLREKNTQVSQVGSSNLSYQDYVVLAEKLFASQFAPKSFKNPADVLSAMLLGKEISLGPMQSLRNIHVVDGRPTLAADIQLALFQKQGGKAKWVRLDNEVATLFLVHPDSGMEVEGTFTFEDAKRAGLTGKDNWKKYPKAMLRSRAITETLKTLGFEPTAGLYDPEELGGPSRFEEVKEPTQPETIKEILENIVTLLRLAPEKAQSAMNYFAANVCLLAQDDNEAHKLLRGLKKRVAELSAETVVEAEIVSEPVAVAA